jgi:hypothetical protein
MSDKFHINPETGNANKCFAKPGNCRFGSDDNHYGSKDEARSAYESSMAGQEFAKKKALKKNPELREKTPEEIEREAEAEADRAYYEQTRLVHHFDAQDLPEAIDKIEKANRRLEKYNIPERFEYEVEEYLEEYKSVGGMQISKEKVKLTLNSPSIGVNGTKFLAVITQEEAGFIVKSGRDVELDGWRPESQACEHCGINRPRSKTYLVEGPDGKRHQIGSTCVDAYLGVKPEGLWAIGEDPVQNMGGGGHVNAANLARPTDHMIAYALAVSDEGKNFVSRSAASWNGGQSTADLIERALWSKSKEDREWAIEMEAKAFQYMANGRAKEVLEQIRAVEGDNDYATNLRTVAKGEYMKPANSGILVSGLSVLRKAEEKAKKESAPKAAVGFAAPEKTKMTGRKAVITGSQDIQSTDYYSGNEITKTKVTFRDENNHELIWWASKRIEVEEGKEITFTGGSVKSHNHYNGTDQTTLTRVKFE